MDELDFDLDGIKPEAPILPSEMEEEEEETRFPYVQFLQPTSTLKGYTKGRASGHIAIGRNVEKMDGSREWEGVLLESGSAIFFIMDHLTSVPDPNDTFRKKAKRTGARALWPYLPDTGRPDQDAKDENGNKAGMLCKSTDGFVPISSYLKRAVQLPANHPEYPGMVVIGVKNVIQPEDALNIDAYEIAEPSRVCLDCPLGKWYTKTTSPKGAPEFWRLCGSKWVFPVFFPPQMALKLTEKAKKPGDKGTTEEVLWEGGIALLQGHSPSVQAALEGDVQGGQLHRTIDDKKIPSIFSFMTPNGKKEVVLRKEEAHPSLLATALAFGADPDSLQAIDETKRAEEVTAAIADPFAAYVKLEVKTFPYAENGHPQLVGTELGLPGMHYLQLNVEQSSWNNHPFVPMISVAEREMDPDHYEAYVEALRFYRSENVRDQLLLTANRQTVEERLTNGFLSSGEEESGGLLESGLTQSVDELSDM